MKKIQDIKKRKKIAKKAEEGSWLDTFWHGARVTHKPVRRRQKVLITGRRLLGFTLVVAILMLATGRAYLVKADISTSAEQVRLHLNQSLILLAEGKYDQALSESTIAKSEVEKIKLNLQSWGQDSRYLQLIDYRSDLVGMEILLTSIDRVLTIATSAQSLVEGLASEMGGQSITGAKEIDFKIDVDRIDRYLSDTLRELAEIQSALERHKVSKSIISEENQMKILSAFGQLAEELIRLRSTTIPLLSWFSGENSEKQIMLLLQNNAELRGSGGFLGSYAILTTHHHAIKKLDFQTNIYKLDNAAIGRVNVPAPPEFTVVSGENIFLRDSNYAVDGPESFAKVLEIYKLESGEALDGVIAMDTSLVTSLLEITGPISLPEYGMTVTAENFLKEVQTEVERDYFARDGNKVENEPKKILADMLPMMLNLTLSKFKSSEGRDRILDILRESISAKHLMFYAKDKPSQEIIESINAGGKLASGEYDYFLSHSTNLGGGKSSLNVKEEVSDHIDILSDGTVSHTVTIRRHHQGDGEWPDSINKNLMRILLPPSSELTGFSVQSGNFQPNMEKRYDNGSNHYLGEEAGRTKLSFWMNTLPQQSSEVTFSYKSAYRINIDGEKSYRLFLQKQAGTNAADYQLTVSYPEDWVFVANYIHTDLQYQLKLDKDKIVELSFR